ncbi:MAG: hypothetical protein ACRDL7_12625, partial [Gaiellaceae bacterium]
MAATTLEFEPPNELFITLSPLKVGAKCLLTLNHPGNTNEHIAFRVSPFVASMYKSVYSLSNLPRVQVTSNTSRCQVSPDYGLIIPRDAATVQISLSEQVKSELLAIYDEDEAEGPAALVNASKNEKIRVEYCATNYAFDPATKKNETFWNKVKAEKSPFRETFQIILFREDSEGEEFSNVNRQQDEKKRKNAERQVQISRLKRQRDYAHGEISRLE